MAEIVVRPGSGIARVTATLWNGRPDGEPMDFVTGFVKDGKARGRPVGVAVDRTGALIVADEVGNTVWRVTATARTTS